MGAVDGVVVPVGGGALEDRDFGFEAGFEALEAGDNFRAMGAGGALHGEGGFGFEGESCEFLASPGALAVDGVVDEVRRDEFVDVAVGGVGYLD